MFFLNSCPIKAFEKKKKKNSRKFHKIEQRFQKLKNNLKCLKISKNI